MDNASYGWSYQVQAGQALQVIGNLQGAIVQLNQHVHVSQSGIGGMGSSAGATAGHFDKMTAALNRFVAGAAGIRLMTSLMDKYGASVRAAREHGEKMGAANLSRKEKLRELAGIMNEPEVNDKVVNEVFRVGLTSGMNFSQSNEFLKGLYGSVPAGIKKGHIRKEQIPEVAEEAARATTRFGLDAYVGGDFAGAIAQHVDLNNQRDAKGNLMSPREAMAAQFGGGVFAANEGRGAVSSLVKEELKVAAVSLTSHRLADMAEVGGFIQAASTISKTGAYSGTKFSQLDAALNHVGDHFGDFLKEIGVAEAKGDRAKLLAFKQHLDQVKPEDAEAYLAEKGLHSREERKSLVGFAANTDVVTKGIDQTRAIMKDGKAQVAANAKFMGTQVGRDLISRVALERSEHTTGERYAEFDIAARTALAQLEQEGKLDDAGIRFDEEMRDSFNFQKLLGAPDALKRMVMRRMAVNVEKTVPDAKGKGLIEKRFGNLPFADQLRYLGARMTGDSTVGPEGTAADQILDRSEPALPADPRAAALAIDRAMKLNPAAAAGGVRRNVGPVLQHRAPAQAGPHLPHGPGGGNPGGAVGGVVGGAAAAAAGHAGVEEHLQAARALQQAAAALMASARANHDTMPGFDGGGYDQHRA